MRRTVIRRDHKVWQYTAPEDCIEVSVMTKVLLSPSRNCEATIRVYRIWEPSVITLQSL